MPVSVNGVGVYFRDFFDSETDYFRNITDEHVFQKLTESNKAGTAFRKGIYLSEVSEVKAGKAEGELHFNLLRCSSNFNGPTEGFCETDRHIIKELNKTCPEVFQGSAKLNHVLAQVYRNTCRPKPSGWFWSFFITVVNYIWTAIFGEQYYNTTEHKAKIKAHSDKTKDMPKDGLIAFCTFYDSYRNVKFTDQRLSPLKKDGFDGCYKNTSALTRLYFKKKGDVKHEFSVTLYPNSVFLIPLSTNGMYTHEIRPSILDADKIPTRMGYVVRCSNTAAVFKDGQTYIVKDEQYNKLVKGTEEDIANLRKLYLAENMTTDTVQYEDIYFSMNAGEYMKPYKNDT